MFKRLALVLVILAFTAGTALAAPLTAKATTVDTQAKTVQATLEVEKVPAWVKKGAAIKIKGLGLGKITEVSDKTVTISTSKASDVKVGDALSFDKASGAGC